MFWNKDTTYYVLLHSYITRLYLEHVTKYCSATDLNFDTKILTIITVCMLVALLTVATVAFASGSSFRTYGAGATLTVTASSSFGRWIYVSGTISSAWGTSAEATIDVRNPSGVQILTSSISTNPVARTDSANFTTVLSTWVNGTYAATVIWADGTTSTSGTVLFAYGTVSTPTSSGATSSTSQSKSGTIIFVNRTTTISSVTTSTVTSTEPGQVTTIRSTVTQLASTIISTTAKTLVRIGAFGITLAGIGVAIAIVACGVSLVALRKH
jgi:hypothetical protein